MKPRTYTYNKGASDERNVIYRKLVREYNRLGKCSLPSDARQLLDTLIAFVRSRQKRYDPKPGGVGRQRKGR